MDGVEEDEHRRHLDNAAYQAAIERAAIQESNESTQEIEERTVNDGKIHVWRHMVDGQGESHVYRPG